MSKIKRVKINQEVPAESLGIGIGKAGIFSDTVEACYLNSREKSQS